MTQKLIVPKHIPKTLTKFLVLAINIEKICIPNGSSDLSPPPLTKYRQKDRSIQEEGKDIIHGLYMFEFYKGRFNIYFAGEKICMMSKMFLGLGAKLLLDESLRGNKI